MNFKSELLRPHIRSYSTVVIKFQGSYLVMDADYAKNFSEDERPFHEFRHSLFVLSTVQSQQVLLYGNNIKLSLACRAIPRNM